MQWFCPFLGHVNENSTFCSCMHVWDILSGNNRDQAFDLKKNETKIRSLELRISRNSLSSLTLTKMEKCHWYNLKAGWQQSLEVSFGTAWFRPAWPVSGSCFYVVYILFVFLQSSLQPREDQIYSSCWRDSKQWLSRGSIYLTTPSHYATSQFDSFSNQNSTSCFRILLLSVFFS